jgi:hypothetical protein
LKDEGLPASVYSGEPGQGGQASRNTQLLAEQGCYAR